MIPFHEVALLIFLFGVTFTLILPSVCKDLGFSVYFVPSKADKIVVDRANEMRVLKAEQTLHDLESSFNPGEPNPAAEPIIKRLHPFRITRRDRLEFAIVVVSVRRRSNPRYLLQTAVRLMAEVRRDRGRSEIVIYNADEVSELHSDAKFLSQFVTVANRSSLVGAATSGGGDDIFEKEKLDYTGALELGLRSGARYVLVVQDDALATREILRKLRYVLKWKMPWKWLRSESAKSWTFLKLYYPEKWQGFGNPEIPELLVIGVLGALCFVALRTKARARKNLDVDVLFLWSGAGLLYFVLVAYTVGRAHWIEMRKLLPLFYGVGNAPGCCIPAVLFPADQATELVKFLNRTNCRQEYPIDFALDDFAKTKGLPGLLVSPNLFSHIGLHSSLHSYDKNPKEFKLLFEP